MEQPELTTEERESNLRFLEHLAPVFTKEKSNLIPILQEAQQRLGYLPRETMLGIAEFLGIPEMDIYSVVTFYNQFRLNPPGKHSIRVCMGTACHVGGGKVILDAWKRRLGIDNRQTTPDREFDLDTVACVGCCAMAPVTVIDDEIQGKISPTRVDGILLSYQIQREKEAQEIQ
ncbi:MAG: NAD(P)H-dependent oxidoreductase subunit E [Chloroflexota bacterium]|nr:NAD(P)H-dependent oxidoreductase subunit E [Chloroflexota bacterium]